MKIQIVNYTFDKATKQITFSDYSTIRLDQILLITDVTNNTVIYQFNDSTKGGTVATNVLTLTYDTNTGAFNNTDKLQIFYDDDKATSKGGYRLVQANTNFTRPADTTAYAVGDAITNSTSAPTVFQLDLGALGAVAGQSIEIRKLCVVSSVKGSTLPLFNVFLSNATFTATNDNAALDIADATQEADGTWLACDVQNFTASNARVSYVNIPAPMQLAAADTKLYGTIQAVNAYTPASGEKLTIIAWVALL
jgi:hypothetical protein